MLHRAASNAYSWWWAGHIRTKQSKWLEQSLQDMEDKVEYVLSLIEEDGDSFAKRAEMYYKRRPELINFVEEAYRAFRALAERYDHLSTELQNANSTLATCFPDQIDLEMDEDDEYGAPKVPRIPSQVQAENVPKVPKAPIELKRLIPTTQKQLQGKKSPRKEDFSKTAANSGLTKGEAVEEIEKLEKDILAMQTVKEFVKSSYQNGLKKYWNMESQIMEKQQRVCKLQDEFDIDKVIEDEEAQKLMAETALKSCQETLAQLRETQQKSAKEAREGFKKMENVRQRLKSLKHEFLPDQEDEGKKSDKEDSVMTGDVTPSSSQDLGEVIQEKQMEMELIHEKIMEQSKASLAEPTPVAELAEKIDELVNTVISLETAVSSQTVLINRLRSESDELQGQIRTLEDNKASLAEGQHELSMRVKHLEEKLNGVQDLNQNFENQNSNLQSHFAEAQYSLDHLSKKLNNTKPEEELDIASSSSQDQEMLSDDNSSHTEEEKPKNLPSDVNESVSLDSDDKGGQDAGASANVQGGDGERTIKKTVTFADPKPVDKEEEDILLPSGNDAHESEPRVEVKKEDLNWQTMLLSGVEDKEKFLLREYSTILRSYKDVKKKLNNREKRERSSQLEASNQIIELKSAVAKRDEEIQRLRHKLKSMQGSTCEDKDIKEGESSASGTEEDNEINHLPDDQPEPIPPLEEKLRMDIDALLDRNMNFWLRFSTSYHQIRKFKNTVCDLQDDISKIREKTKQYERGNTNRRSITTNIKSDVRPLYKHLKEIQTELMVWVDQSSSLKDESERRFSSLCFIQEEISLALKRRVEEEEEIELSNHQAAKFQGEVLNMKQENNKVREELQTCFDHITSLQVEVDRTLTKLNEEFGLLSDQSKYGRSSSINKIPLRSFLFGTKPKKQKHSIFACIHPNKKYQVLRAGLHM